MSYSLDSSSGFLHVLVAHLLRSVLQVVIDAQGLAVGADLVLDFLHGVHLFLELTDSCRTQELLVVPNTP